MHRKTGRDRVHREGFSEGWGAQREGVHRGRGHGGCMGDTQRKGFTEGGAGRDGVHSGRGEPATQAGSGWGTGPP